jgi:polyketide cyclase/dehydrase/lipid transport protein
MFLKIGLGVLAAFILFLAYVSTRPGSFRYERSGVIQASAEKIFPYISNLRMGEKWSPYEKADPNLKKTYIGSDGQVGSIMEFDGNSEAGSGKLEILKIVPNDLVQLKLTMTRPFFAENLIDYKLTSVSSGTEFSWAMAGDGGFLGKLISVFIDCEKMVAGEFTRGIANLKTVVEAQK